MLKTYNKGLQSPEQLKEIVEQSLDTDKAEDIVTIDLKGQTAIADYMVIASGTSTRQVSAMAEKLRDRLKALGVSDIRIEGKDLCNWVILDAGDVIVHLFRPEVREFYNIEKMWQSYSHGQDITRNIPV
ncbi:MAG: ribosome silencing factor [Alphaproteobacteria bacterium CG_4_9_14_3_um_filter_47_13]|nr:MAG: ribosome silencing factor [Alphaproteobacteria bacterium CG_4_9_14_3_um_filter_47_13]